MFSKFKKTGFTLIELLVVIAVIALLLAISAPALRKAKEQAAQIPCMANQRSIALAFQLYQEENDGKLLSAYTWYRDVQKSDAWVYPPTDYDASGNIQEYDFDPYDPQECTVEREIRGIKKGKMWAYLEDEDVYHCPADKRASRANVGFRSYSLVVTIRHYYQGALQEHAVSKMSEIKVPSSKYVSVEGQRMIQVNGERQWHWNMGAWYYNVSDRIFGEPPANWHNDGVSLAFADGHAEKYKWQSPEMDEWLHSEQITDTPPDSVKGTEDAEYFYRHIPRRK